MTRAIFSAARDVVPFDRASVVVLDGQSRAHKVATFYGDTSVVQRRDVLVSGNVRRVLSTGEPLVNQGLTAYDGAAEALVDAGIRSTIVVPFTVDTQVVGTLNLASLHQVIYGEAELARAQGVAARFARAVDRARQLGGEAGSARPLDEDMRGAPSPSRLAPMLFRPERVLDHMTEALLIDDVDGRVVFVNRAFRELFGVQEGELGSMVLEDYVAPEYREALRQRHEHRVRGKPALGEFDYVGVRADGTRLDLEASVVPVIEDGVILGTQSVIRDVGERKRMADRTVHAQKMEALGQLASGIAHDFNNLLTALVAYPEIIRERLADGESVTEDLADLELAAERAMILTRQLRSFSRQRVVGAESVEVGAALATFMPVLRRLIEHDTALTFEQSTIAAAVRIDPGQLEQIIINLVVNARDACPTEISVRLELLELDAEAARKVDAEEGPYVLVTVGDDGTGMTPEVRSRAFQPFFTTKAVGEGTGLGLATVYGIVHASGGQIHVDSEPGVGTTFEIYLPAVSEVAQITVSLPPSVEPRDATVLLAEDDAVSRRVLKAILESGGLTVIEARDGGEAMAIVDDRAVHLDLVISDLMMPVAGGTEVVSHVRASRPKLPVVLVSGHAGGKLTDTIAGLDVPFVAKPVKRDVLLRAASDALDGVVPKSPG